MRESEKCESPRAEPLIKIKIHDQKDIEVDSYLTYANNTSFNILPKTDKFPKNDILASELIHITIDKYSNKNNFFIITILIDPIGLDIINIEETSYRNIIDSQHSDTNLVKDDFHYFHRSESTTFRPQDLGIPDSLNITCNFKIYSKYSSFY